MLTAVSSQEVSMASIFIVGGTGVGHESFSAEKVRDPASSASADSGFRPHAQYTHIVLLPVGGTGVEPVNLPHVKRTLYQLS